jgi:hypothetical protein
MRDTYSGRGEEELGSEQIASQSDARCERRVCGRCDAKSSTCGLKRWWWEM